MFRNFAMYIGLAMYKNTLIYDELLIYMEPSYIYGQDIQSKCI